jgi:hypothetical protein
MAEPLNSGQLLTPHPSWQSLISEEKTLGHSTSNAKSASLWVKDVDAREVPVPMHGSVTTKGMAVGV